MKNIKSIIVLVFVALVAAGSFAFLTYTGQIASNPASTALINVTRPYPALAGPKTVTLSCNYHGNKLSVNETLYASVDSYYRDDPIKKIAYLHNDNKAFVFENTKDDSIAKLTSDIRVVATANSLDADQTLDLAACFLQSIPYDNTKASKILSPDSFKYSVSELIPRYPYETLYDFSGICTDKSYLGALVFEKLGYRTSLLVFDKERHMSIGVGVPDGYGDFGTKYAIMELTGQNFLVGDVPKISGSAGLAINNISTLPGSDSVTAATADIALSNPSGMVDVSSGTNYVQIVDRIALRNELTQLRSQLETMSTGLISAKASLTTEEQKLSAAEASYRSNPTTATYSNYRTVYNQYLVVYNDVQSKIADYNSLVTDYNAKVARYRVL